MYLVYSLNYANYKQLKKMSNFTYLDKSVYRAIYELHKFKPDGELSYTKLLLSYLKGDLNKDIPRDAIKSSKVYGKFPKTNILKLLNSLKNLVAEGYLTELRDDGNFKYLLTDKRIYFEDEHLTFVEKVSKYKKYLIIEFKRSVESFCPQIMGCDKDNYFGFVNRKPVFQKEYNWFWLSDVKDGKFTLKLSLRNQPNHYQVMSELYLSYETFNDCLMRVFDILKNKKDEFHLEINDDVKLPEIKSYKNTLSKSSVEQTVLEINQLCGDGLGDFIISNRNTDCSDVSLTVSEQSPFKLSGDTIFTKQSLKDYFKTKSYFEFSFLKWRIAAWTLSQNIFMKYDVVLLISKKNHNLCVIISLQKKKVLFVTNEPFILKNETKEISLQNIVENVFYDL